MQVSVVDKGYFIGNCGFESRHFYPEDNRVKPFSQFTLPNLQDAVSEAYFATILGRNSVVVLYGKVIRFDSGNACPVSFAAFCSWKILRCR